MIYGSQRPRHGGRVVACLSFVLHGLQADYVNVAANSAAWLPRLQCRDGRSRSDICKDAAKRCRKEAAKLPTNSNPSCAIRTAIAALRSDCFHVQLKEYPVDIPDMFNDSSDATFQWSSVIADDAQISAAFQLDVAFSTTRLRKLLDIRGGWEPARAFYLNTKPFPYTIMDNFLPSSIVTALQNELPCLGVCDLASLAALGWRRPALESSWHWLKWTLPMSYPNVEYGRPVESLFGPIGRALLGHLRSGPFLEFLERLTGIGHLLPDPMLWGGGYHEISSGGYLGVHTDFARHPEYYNFERRVNVFLFLNDNDWPKKWGGALELWEENADSSGLGRCAVRIRPRGGRIVVFSTSEMAMHGHPWPLNTPENVTRRSLALYYYKVAGEGHWMHPKRPAAMDTMVQMVPCRGPEDQKCYGSTVDV